MRRILTSSLPVLIFICGMISPFICERAFADDGEQTKAMMAEYSAGKYDDAFRRCIAILRVNPANMTAHYFMGNLYLHYKKLDQAAAEYKYCMSAGEGSPEYQSAKQGLDAVEQHRSAVPPLAEAPGAAAAPGQAAAVDAKVQDRIDRFNKEAEDLIAAKKRTYDAGVAHAQEDARAQTPAWIFSNGRPWYNSVMASVNAEKQAKLNRLKDQYDKDVREIKEHCEKQIKELQESHGSGAH